VVTRSAHAPAVEAAVRRDSDAPIFYAQTELDSVRHAAGERCDHEMAGARDRKWFAFCGIGNPAGFLSDLGAWGFRVVGQRTFPDHHRYTQAEADELAAAARDAGADGLLCTEKDRFNLGAVRGLAIEAAYCRISLKVARTDEFWAQLMAAAGRRSSQKR
jgi:tetraacyldisaccharide-1-P 4'-kinase